jgi:DNA-directed RNA polymerase subunit M/transcription elongation factor TFIIS
MPERRRALKCPTCGGTTVNLAGYSGKHGDLRFTEFYRCRNTGCEGAFRATFFNGQLADVAALWSKLTDSKD